MQHFMKRLGVLTCISIGVIPAGADTSFIGEKVIYTNYFAMMPREWTPAPLTLDVYLSKVLDQFQLRDTNKDGILSDDDGVRSGYRPTDLYEPAPMPNKSISREGVARFATEFFHALDVDHDGVVTMAEADAYKKQVLEKEYPGDLPSAEKGCVTNPVP